MKAKNTWITVPQVGHIYNLPWGYDCGLAQRPAREASKPALRGLATPKLKTIEPVEPVPAHDGKHARRALADLNARRGHY